MLDWSKFEEEVRSHVIPRGPKCAVGRMLDRLPEEAQAAVGRALDDRGLTNSAIHRALSDRLGGEAPSLFSISNHRRSYCQCRSLVITMEAS